MTSGGPRPGSGRKKGSTTGLQIEARVLARNHAKKAIDTLVKAMQVGSWPVKVDAAEKILNRAFGKPAQSVELTGKDGGAIQHEEVNNDATAFSRAIAGLFARADEAEGSGKAKH